MTQLADVIQFRQELCNSCHRCIGVCPVKFCNNGNGDHVSYDKNMCIGCGECLDACETGARLIKDDWDDFLNRPNGEKVIAIAAPAVTAAFPHEQAHVFGWLNSVGVEAFFDVSFGAELTVQSYLEHIRQNEPEMVIAQPCPAIVTYIQLYQPELIPYLAPADSPMVHTIKYIDEFHPQYRDHSILVISPCIAKKREFEEIGLGGRVYNVTIDSLKKHIADQHLSLGGFPPMEFTGMPAERAVLFSSPGGLLQTVEREQPELCHASRKIEGADQIYEYLSQLPDIVEKKMNPLLVDCLNCSKGCNGGTGTGNRKMSPDELEFYVRRRRDSLQVSSKKDMKTLAQSIKNHWKTGLYDRGYRSLEKNNTIQFPDEETFSVIYQKMYKTKPEDHYNCSSCGYSGCEQMAVAVHNGLNRPENCYHFLLEEARREKEVIVTIKDEIRKSGTDMVNEILSSLGELTVSMKNQDVNNQQSIKALTEMMTGTEDMLSKIGDVESRISELGESATIGQEKARNASRDLSRITRSLGELNEIMDRLEDISGKINILSVNASIEAARAGDSGKGFSVVATEVRKLASRTDRHSQSTRDIIVQFSETMGQFRNLVQGSMNHYEQLLESTNHTHRFINELNHSIYEQSAGSRQIQETVDQATMLSHQVNQNAGTLMTAGKLLLKKFEALETSLEDYN